MRAINFQNDIPSFAIDNFKHHGVLVFDLSSVQDAIGNFHYQKLVGGSLRLELNFTFPLEHVTELIVLGERMSLVQNDKLGLLKSNSKLNNVSFHQLSNHKLLLKHGHLV